MEKREKKVKKNFCAIRKRLAEQKGLGMYDTDEIKYIEKPLGMAAFTGEKPKNTEPAKWYDRVECEVCGTVFTRSARSKHKSTRRHQDYLMFHEKFREFVLKK